MFLAMFFKTQNIEQTMLITHPYPTVCPKEKLFFFGIVPLHVISTLGDIGKAQSLPIM